MTKQEMLKWLNGLDEIKIRLIETAQKERIERSSLTIQGECILPIIRELINRLPDEQESKLKLCNESSDVGYIFACEEVIRLCEEEREKQRIIPGWTPKRAYHAALDMIERACQRAVKGLRES